MTKEQLIKSLQAKTGLHTPLAKEAVETFLSTTKEALMNGEKASFVGFGTFSTKTRPARTGRNPRTGEPIIIPEKRVVVFKPGKSFREMVAALDMESD